ncbi:hypothetical protein STCU_11802 [Strigomonas culicis]|nr:hypothetical protein STCU_11802 [Strigomonas culicis]|eukprot:EPY15732.1 hypothetical protein STCU_11802 [Strigomonas culicis]
MVRVLAQLRKRVRKEMYNLFNAHTFADCYLGILAPSDNMKEIVQRLCYLFESLDDAARARGPAAPREGTSEVEAQLLCDLQLLRSPAGVLRAIAWMELALDVPTILAAAAAAPPTQGMYSPAAAAMAVQVSSDAVLLLSTIAVVGTDEELNECYMAFEL